MQSPQSVVVIDDIEGILDWVPIGPRFSNTVLSALRTLITKPPPNGRHRLVLGTTSARSTLQQLDFLRVFQGEIPVPNVNTPQELGAILSERSNFQGQDIRRVLTDLQDRTGRETIGVGIKAVLVAIERSSESGDPPERFSEIIGMAIAEQAY
jgi:vesicle-fusing ATPase